MIEYKGYYIKPNKATPQHLNIVTVGQGGKIPVYLTGLFTSVNVAEMAIDNYLASKEKGSRNGKASSESGD